MVTGQEPCNVVRLLALPAWEASFEMGSLDTQQGVHVWCSIAFHVLFSGSLCWRWVEGDQTFENALGGGFHSVSFSSRYQAGQQRAFPAGHGGPLGLCSLFTGREGDDIRIPV